MKVNSAMRPLVANPSKLGRATPLPADLEEVIMAGWREGPGGVLLLAGTDEFPNKSREVRSREVGEYEYDNNHVTIPDDDLIRTVPRFKPRLDPNVPLLDDEQIDYRGPDGQLFDDIRIYLRRLVSRSLTFASGALAQAGRQQLNSVEGLMALVSAGVVGDVLVHGASVRFTTGRGVPSSTFDMRWFDDLERFKLEAVAVLTMADAQRP